jgi:hypothetical protein
MTPDQRIRLAIGDIVIQLQAALSRIEELEGELGKTREKDQSAEKFNGGGLLRDVTPN